MHDACQEKERLKPPEVQLGVARASTQPARRTRIGSRRNVFLPGPAANDLVPSGKSIAGTYVPNHRFFAIRRRPRDGVVRTGELDVGTVGKGYDYSVVRSDHVEPFAGAGQSKRVITAQNVGAPAAQFKVVV